MLSRFLSADECKALIGYFEQNRARAAGPDPTRRLSLQVDGESSWVKGLIKDAAERVHQRRLNMRAFSRFILRGHGRRRTATIAEGRRASWRTTVTKAVDMEPASEEARST
jgi:hypothetical protein